MRTQIFKKYEDFLNREDESINGVSPEFAEEHPHYERDNVSNHGCWNCYECRNCSFCQNCFYTDYRSCGVDANTDIVLPVVDNIHSKVAAAVFDGENLDMESWHHSCRTVHCMAGWAVHLAGKEGYELEDKLGPGVAAKLIYEASSSIPVTDGDFNLDNKTALSLIKWRAKEDRKNNKRLKNINKSLKKALRNLK